MKTKSLLIVTITLSVISLRINTFAAPLNLPPERPSITDLLDITDLGGTVTSTDSTTYIMVGNNTTSINPVKEVSSVDIKIDTENTTDTISRVITEEDFEKQDNPTDNANLEDIMVNNEDYNNAAVVAILAKDEEDARIAEEKRKQEEHQKLMDSVSWLADYNVDTSNLSEDRIKVLSFAHQFLGTPYVWGGTTPSGFDCSGYTSYVLAKTTGILLPRTTYDQIDCSAFEKIPISEALPGDIIFNPSVSHTGFFIKDCGDSILLMHAPYTGTVLKISSYRRPQYVYRYLG